MGCGSSSTGAVDPSVNSNNNTASAASTKATVTTTTTATNPSNILPAGGDDANLVPFAVQKSNKPEKELLLTQVPIDKELDFCSVLPNRLFGTTDMKTFEELVEKCLAVCVTEEEKQDAVKFWNHLREGFQEYAGETTAYEVPTELDENGYLIWTPEQVVATWKWSMFSILDPRMCAISPHKLAQQLEISSDIAISQFLHATTLGGLVMTFHSLCKSCGWSLAFSKSISELPMGDATRCTGCGEITTNTSAHDIMVQYDWNQQLYYLPAIARSYCHFSEKVIGSMMPPTGFFIPLPPGKHRVKNVKLEAGCKYFGFCPFSLTAIQCDVVEENSNNASQEMKIVHSETQTPNIDGKLKYTLTSTFDLVADLDIKSSLTFMYGKNHTSNDFADVYTEEMFRNATTAPLVLNNYKFSEYFPKQILTSGQHLSVQGITLVFTDLADSTRMFARIGDGNAIDVVKKHFEVVFAAVAHHRGRVVKTIGDAVMCAFPYSSLDAVAAMVESITVLRKVNQTLPQDRQLLLKIGLHHGTAAAVPLNGVNDFLGQNVNIAARVQGKAQSEEIVVSGQAIQSLNALHAAAKKDPTRFGILENVQQLASSEILALKGVEGGVSVNRFTVSE